MAVGAGGAFTGGENRLPPGAGLIDFSVGATGAGGGGAVVVVVVVVVVVSGRFLLFLVRTCGEHAHGR